MYLLPPSFRAAVLDFLTTRIEDDVAATVLEQQFQQLKPSFVIDHDLSQSAVNYLKKMPYEQVYRLIAGFGSLELVPDEEVDVLLGSHIRPAIEKKEENDAK